MAFGVMSRYYYSVPRNLQIFPAFSLFCLHISYSQTIFHYCFAFVILFSKQQSIYFLQVGVIDLFLCETSFHHSNVPSLVDSTAHHSPRISSKSNITACRA